MDNQRCANSTFMHPVFIHPEWGRRRISPRLAVGQEIPFSRTQQFFFSTPQKPSLGTCTIVGQKENQGVFKFAGCFQRFDDPPDLLVHTIHLRSEEHTSELQSLMRISYAVFCLK